MNSRAVEALKAAPEVASGPGPEGSKSGLFPLAAFRIVA